MLRWTLAALLAAAATPSYALVQFDSAFAFFSAPSWGSEDFEPGLGTTSRSISSSDIGGCEGADETGERCGAYENSVFTLTLTNNSFAYDAGIRQQQDIVNTTPSTDYYVYAVFRADREMRLNPQELRSISIPYCNGICSNNLGSNVFQYQEGDGSWRAVVEVGTSATTRNAFQEIGHSLNLTIAEVPEPGAWAMLITGFGLVGATQRRRRLRKA